MVDKKLMKNTAAILVLKLLSERDMYGYEIISTLKKRSDYTFHMKAGTIYPLLHSLEKNEILESYEKQTWNEVPRKYYRLTKSGGSFLDERQHEWAFYYKNFNKNVKGVNR
ncbi:MAG: PadR family transcriptional regulator [Bacillota bacterium]